MNEHEKLIEAGWRRVLTPEEEAALQLHLAASPEKQLDWEDEAGLTRALQNLPDAPLSSNFTARVLQAVEREEQVRERTASFAVIPAWLRPWVPRLASVAVMLLIALIALNFYQGQSDPAVDIVAISTVAAALPEPEVLEDFETIQQLRTASEFSDDELVAVLLK